MGIFRRLSDIVSANVNALIDKAEDPERMIAQIIREMEDGLADARRYAATAIAAERRLGRELEQNRVAVEHWKAKARDALVAEREDLARRALVRKREHDDLVRGLEAQHAAALETSDHVKTSLRALEARLAEARRKQRSLLARARAAKARVELARTIGITDPGASFTRFERLENRLTEYEDELLAQADLAQSFSNLETDFADLEHQQQVEEELQALKKELAP